MLENSQSGKQVGEKTRRTRKQTQSLAQVGRSCCTVTRESGLESHVAADRVLLSREQAPLEAPASDEQPSSCHQRTTSPAPQMIKVKSRQSFLRFAASLEGLVRTRPAD